MFINGDLIKVVNPCHGLRSSSGFSQMQLPGITPGDLYDLSPGDVGIVIKSVFYEEAGWLTEAIFGEEILADISSDHLVAACAI